MNEYEWIETDALAELHSVADHSIVSSLNLQYQREGDSLVSMAGNLPSSAIAINRALGLANNLDKLQQVKEGYHAAGVERFFISGIPNGGAEEADAFEAQGIKKARAWQKFCRGREAIPTLSRPYEVRPVDGRNARHFSRIVCRAFDLGEQAEPWLEKLHTAQHWHLFLCIEESQAAGAGALFIKDGIAWTDWGATCSRFRQRGIQSALLHHRLQYALDHDCKTIVSCTGEAVPGDPQHSFNNLLKFGFKPDYVRQNYAPMT